jgi:hypothetical protein
VSEQPAQGAPPEQAEAHENPLARAGQWLHAHEGQAQAGIREAAAVAEELKPLLKGHAAGVFALAGKVLSSPEFKAIAPDMLELVVTAAQLAGAAL